MLSYTEILMPRMEKNHVTALFKSLLSISVAASTHITHHISRTSAATNSVLLSFDLCTSTTLHHHHLQTKNVNTYNKVEEREG